MGAVKHVSIIIVDYNARDYTLNCLESLVGQKAAGYNFTALVVDNGSKVPFKLPKRLQNPLIEIIRSNSNLGFTGGNNLGIYYSIEKYNSEYILLLNNDTVVSEDFLRNMLKCAEEMPRAGVISPKIYFSPGAEYHQNSYKREERGKIFWYAGGALDWPHLVAFHRGVDEFDYGQFDNQQHSDFATGCAMLISREVLEKIGTLDKRYFLYLEDVDFSMRVHKAGYEIGFCPDAVVWHKNAGSSGGAGSSIHDYYQTRNRLLFAFKHGEWQQWLTALRLAYRDFFSGNEKKRMGVSHALINRYGKQAVY